MIQQETTIRIFFRGGNCVVNKTLQRSLEDRFAGTGGGGTFLGKRNECRNEGMNERTNERIKQMIINGFPFF